MKYPSALPARDTARSSALSIAVSSGGEIKENIVPISITFPTTSPAISSADGVSGEATRMSL